MGRITVIILKSSAYIFAGDFFMDKNKKQDYLIKAILFQFLFCSLIFAFFYSIKYTDNAFFKTIKQSFFDEINKSITTEEVKETFKKIENFTENEFILTDFSDELFTAEILGEGGKDVEINNEIISNVSFANYKLNYKIFSPVIDGVVSSEFGERVHPINGTLGVHKGIDIALDEGEPIYAIFDGEIIEADYDQWNGNYIKIKHDNDIISVYCHCSKLFVKKGDIIRGGEVIASVGSTGQSTGPHIHFEIRIKDVSYNPAYALKDAKDAV